MEEDDKQREIQMLLEEAKGYARNKQPKEWMEVLYNVGILGKYRRKLLNEWRNSLTKEDVDIGILEGIYATYDRLAGGHQVEHLPSYIYKSAQTELIKIASKRQYEYLLPPDSPYFDRADPYDPYDPEAEARHEARVKQALTVARSLLKRLGQQNVQRVMSLIFDAIEHGENDLDNQQIADILGISLDVVRQSKKRGFDRLTRIAREEGLIDAATLAEVLHTYVEDSDEDDHDEEE